MYENVSYNMCEGRYSIQPAHLCNLIGIFPFLTQSVKYKQSGPGCSKLTTLLVNVSLKFQTLISELRQYFC